MRVTINQINRELKAIAESHIMINSYFYGDFLDIYESNKVKQTSLLANINSSPIDKHYITLNIDLMVMDKIDDGKKNAVDVESDCLQIVNDIYQVMYYSEKWQNWGLVPDSINPLKFTERGGDVVNGWFVTIGFKVKKDKQGVCDLPLIGYSYEL